MGQGSTLTPSFVPPGVTWPLRWYSFLIEAHAPYGILYIVGFLNFSMIGLFMVQLTNFCLLFYWSSKNSLNWRKFLDLIVYTALLSHLFLPRGVFKYYFTFLIPLLTLWICFHFGSSLTSLPLHRKKFLLLFLATSLILLLIPRLFYLLFVWIIFFFMLKYELSVSQSKKKVLAT